MRKGTGGALLLERGDRESGRFWEAKAFALKTGALANTPPGQKGHRFKVLKVGHTEITVVTEPEMMEYFGLNPVTAKPAEPTNQASNGQRPSRWDPDTGRYMR